MSLNLDKIGVVVLAAGKGTRLGCVDRPKVMLEIGEKPIVSYLVETLFQMGFQKNQICLVVNFCQEKVREYFSDKVSYAEQKETLGTAHAAYTGMIALPQNIETVLVVNGDDGAFYKAETLKELVEKHLQNQVTVSVLTVEPENPEIYGRVVREENGNIKIVEKENLTEEQKNIKEINTGTFCFERSWFEKIFPVMPKINNLNEYGLPTVVDMANAENLKVQAVKLSDSSEWFGINKPDELEEANRRKLM